MEEKKVISLKKELALKKFQFNSIYEFSESIYSHFQIENIQRIYFSTLMGQLGVSRIFLLDTENKIFHKRGFRVSDSEETSFARMLKKLDNHWFFLKTEELPPEQDKLKELLETKKIHCLINITESEKRRTVVGLGDKLSKQELTTENIEYVYFVSKFSLSAIENAIMINKLIESKRVEHELNIARDIQLSLLPQSVPQMENFEVGVIYTPINEVGGDYYDILKERKGQLPLLVADVEGKGLSAALLAASSQAIFHSLNDLYFFEAGKFFAKANSLICDFTKGSRFITIFWMLLNDENKSITYVNAGHVEPILISLANDRVTRLEKGGFLTGFMADAEYEKETLELQSGDILVAFTDGVPEVENKAGEEFGIDAMISYVKEHHEMSAEELTHSLSDAIFQFSQNVKYRDDFTLIVLKVK